MTTRTQQLIDLMAKRGLSVKRVAELTDRSAATVRVWRCQTEGARVIPAHTLAVLRAKVEPQKDTN